MPKKSAHHRATETSTAQSNTVNISEGPIHWDSSPNTLAIFAASLMKKCITKADPWFRSLIKSGAVVTSDARDRTLLFDLLLLDRLGERGLDLGRDAVVLQVVAQRREWHAVGVVQHHVSVRLRARKQANRTEMR